MDKSKLTHAELVEIGARWLDRKGYKVVLKELSANNEIPDSIGFRTYDSYLLEAKCSRGDFLADKKKRFRKRPSKGMGMYRAFICPKDLIKPEELPKGWGLIYVSEKGRTRYIVKSEKFDIFNLRNEFVMLLSVARRVIDKFPYKKYLHRSE